MVSAVNLCTTLYSDNFVANTCHLNTPLHRTGVSLALVEKFRLYRFTSEARHIVLNFLEMQKEKGTSRDRLPFDSIKQYAL